MKTITAAYTKFLTVPWKAILNTLTVHYGDRIADHIR